MENSYPKGFKCCYFITLNIIKNSISNFTTIIISSYTVFVKVVLEMQVDLLLAIWHSIVQALLCQLKYIMSHKNECYHAMMHTELDNTDSKEASWLVAMK